MKQKLPRSVRENGRSCREPKDFLARLRGSDSGQVTEATFQVGSTVSGRDRTVPLKKEIRPRLLRNKRRPEIRVIAALLDGRELSLQKRVRICR